MRMQEARLWSGAMVIAGCCLWPQISKAQVAAPPAGDIDEEIARQQQVVERFLKVLERNPRRGTALDRIYGFHVENGSLEAFVKQLRDRVTARPQDGTGWMILGLVESQRGRDAAAVEALTKARDLRPADPLAAYYLGQTLVLVGQPENAVAAFETAIARKPAQADLLEMFQALGRVHQRAQRTQEALAVWSRLEKLFPGDPRVQEQIAVTLVEEGQLAEALPRYEALAKATTDDYRRTVFRVEAAELKVKLNRVSEGIADLESLLAKLNPESWLFRDVRRKIEEVFLRSDDQDGLAKYYAGWLTKNAEDVEAMARLARVLARQGRVPEAQVWLDKALKLAPSRRELRLAFIEQLVDDQRYPEAIQQYVALDKADPNNPDYLRDWGKLILRDTTRPKEARQADAEQVWQRLLSARPDDPLIATQVADLFRHAEMSPQALALYQKAVELAPASAQYREYLGEYYHILKRPEDALATWREITAGNQRTAANLTRLAEVLAQFGYLPQALPEIAAACELDPKDFSLQLKAADLQIRGEQYDAALASLSRAGKLAQNDEEREAVLFQEIKTFTLQDKLAGLARQLAAETAGGSATHGQLFLLARYREALREYPEATRAINAALAAQPNHVPSLAAAARIAEHSGDLKTASDLNRKLAVVDRRGRSEYLEHVAQLETQLGRVDEALAAGQELIAAAPGNVETYQFFADLCFRLRRNEDGINALRRATRVNPGEANVLLALAAALAGQFRTDEAIELYWQAFDKGAQLDDKLMVVGKLGELYLQTNRFDQLLERLERGRREDSVRREMTICLAQAYHAAGDYGMARQELERLLAENNRDTQLLQQLSKLAESEADIASAVKFQEQLAKLAPGAETEYRLATLLTRAGSNQEAAAILVRLAAKEEDQEKLLRNIDGLLSSGQEETALLILEPKRRENPADWEILYREGVAHVKRNPAEAKARFQAILDLSLADDELGVAAKNRLQNQQKSASAAPAATTLDQNVLRLEYSHSVRRAIGIDRDPYYYSPSGRAANVWTPADFAQARMAAVAWLYKLARDANQADAFIAEQSKVAESERATPRQLWDWIYLQTMLQQQGQPDLLPFARRLARQGGLPERYLYLNQLASRNSQVIQPRRQGPEVKDTTPPLPPDDLALALACFESVRKITPAPQSSLEYYLQTVTATMLAELARAGRKEDEQKLYADFLTAADSVGKLSSAMALARQRKDRAGVLALFERLAAKDLQTPQTGSSPASGASASRARQTASEHLCLLVGTMDTPPEESLAVLDRFLSYHAAKTNQQRSSPMFRPAARTPSQRASNYVYIYSGNSQRSVVLSFPQQSDYFDQPALALVRNVFEAFRQKDLASDLIKHLESRAAAAPAAEKLYALLALAYVQAWDDEREAAVPTMEQAAVLVPQDMDLRLEIARLYVEMQQLDEALARVDAIAPLDQRTLQQREMLALDLAVRLGDHQRARDAASRLFGLRLDAEAQVNLSSQMRRLGMNEEAEAILARAQRQAGSRLSALSALMVQYQSQGRMDVAAQVAFQILRRSRTAPTAQVAMGYSTVDSQYRTSALACLAQAGKLKELIAALEDQIKRSPQATQLHETLSEYYQAAGETQKVLDLQAAMVKERPADGELRYRYAQELYRRGKHAEACEEYKVVLKLQPQLLSRRYHEVLQAFQRAKKQAELAQVIGEIDLRSIGQPYLVQELMNQLMQTPEGKPAGMALFKKAFESMPDQRPELMGSFYDPEMWKLPEVIEYGKRAILPTAEGVRRDPWYGVYTGSISYVGDGRISNSLTRVLDGAAGANQLGKLRDQIAAAAAQHPGWLAGPALLMLIDLRQKKQFDVEAALKPLLDAESSDYRLLYARWIVGQELEANPAHRELAMRLYARTMETNRDNQQFTYSPAARLVRIYKEQGRMDDARALMLRAANDQTWRNQGDAYYAAQQVENLVAIGGLFQEMDDPVNALRMYRQVLTDPVLSDPSVAMNYASQPDYFTRQAQQGLQVVLKKYGERPSAAFALALISPVESPRPGTPAIDLMVAASTPPAGQLAVLESPLAKFVRPQGASQAALAQIESQLAGLAEKHPRDLSVAMAAALFALQGTDANQAAGTLARLDKLVADLPLEEIAVRQRPNARQRSEAAQQIPLWLVARECLKLPPHRYLGERLARRSIAAAQRQLDTVQLSAILYERGRLALESGDRPAAESAWNELIDLAIVQPRQPRSSGANNPPRGGPIPATLSQFTLGVAISQAAADGDLPALSLRAIREVLAGGLPVADLPKSGADPFASPSRIMRISSGPATTSRGDVDQAVFGQVASRVWQLSQVWERRGLPPTEVCQLLEGLVFPPSRPGDVLLYDQPAETDLTSPRSVGRLLVEWSIRAERTAELEKQIAARRATPTDVVSGQVLLVQLAVARGQADRAQEHLQAIAKELQTSKLASLTQLAAHAAGMALDDPRLAADALPILDKLTTPVPGRSVSSAVSNNAPATLLTRQYIKYGDLASARSQADRYLQNRTDMYARYSGDTGQYYQRQDLAWAANELARAGDLPTTLAALARHADVPAAAGRDVQASVAVWHLARQARKLPAPERYDLLREWSLPTKDRRSVRLVAEFDSGQAIPELFVAASKMPYEPAPSLEPISNLTLLVEAARDTGKLEELSRLVEPLVAEKVPGSAALGMLVQIAQRDPAVEPQLAQLAESIRQRSQPDLAPDVVASLPSRGRVQPPVAVDWGDLLVVHAALAEPLFAQSAIKPAELLLDQARRSSGREITRRLESDLVRNKLASVTAEERPLVTSPLALWFAGQEPKMLGAARFPTLWTAHEGHLVHVTGYSWDQLYFRYPLEGEFEFSFDSRTAGSTQVGAGYGGLVCTPNESHAQIASVMEHDTVSRPGIGQNGDGWNRTAIRVGPAGVRFYFNGRLVYEDQDASRGSPWLHLQSLADRHPAMRNLRISGRPTIPREVRLLDRDRLEGWIAVGERLPRRIVTREPFDPSNSRYESYYDANGNLISPLSSQTALDWSAHDGVLKATIDPAAATHAQSRLYYHRPLQPGERVRYQFRYQPGVTHVHPAIGPIAFLLEPSGVRLHWISAASDLNQSLLVDPRNAVDDPASRRGPAALPLKENDWNDVELAIAADSMRLSLNGELIYERPIEPTSDRRFGLFRYKGQTAAEVRNVVLTADWPQSLAASELSDLLVLAPHRAGPVVLRARHTLVGEGLLATEAYEVWRRSRDLAASDKYEFLKGWVLPSESHPVLRLTVDWAPTDPPPPASGERQQPGAAHSGAEVVSPAWELVAVAAELGKLDELAAAVSVAAKEHPTQARNIAAFQTLLALARDDDAAAAGGLKQSLEFLKQQPAETPLHERHAEYLAVHAAMSRPSLRAAALELAEQLVTDQLDKRYVNPYWERRVRQLKASAQWAADPAIGSRPLGAGPPLAQWLPVNWPTALSRGLGFNPPAWRLAAGEAHYLTGNGRDALYFAMPLVGDFELRCERSTYGWREIRPLYGAVAFDLNGDGQGVIRHEFGRGPTETRLSEKIKDWGPMVQYRLVVKEGQMTVFVNDQQIASEPLPPDVDPWLAIESQHAHFAGVVRNVQILGNPSVPREVAMSASPSLAGWSADYYGESAGAANTTWSRKADEIVAAKLDNCPGSFRESLLQYHRPLLEDGELEYEFVYEAGKTEVHPAVDRLVFLLDPAGARIHWLTDAQYDRTGLAPDNSEPLAGAAACPLKEGEWNKLKLALVGDKVTIEVNGVRVAQRKLESTNQRTFGLFRYADATGARIRNVVHRGQWQTELPPLPQQELAVNGANPPAGKP